MAAPACVPLQMAVPLLVVSPDEQDHSSLQNILRPGCSMLRAAGRRDAVALAMFFRPKVVLCEQVFADGDWRDLLRELDAHAPEAPPVIVCSRLADDRLWAEVLNLGGYDVLSKPFASAEVNRVVGMAASRRARPRATE